MQTQYETLLVTVDGPIVEVLLNRPAKRNAINFQMVKDLNSVPPSVRTRRTSSGIRSAKEAARAATCARRSPSVTPASIRPSPGCDDGGCTR